MKPVELEIIMRDSTRQGMQSVTGNVEELNQRIAKQNALIKQLENDLRSMQAAFEKASRAGDQTDNIAMVAALKKEVAALKGELVALEKQQKKTASAPTVAPAAAPSAAPSVSTLGLKEQKAELKANIKFMEDYVKQYEKSMKNMAPGKEKAIMTQELEGAKAALLGEKEALVQLEAQMGSTGQKQTMLRTQIMQLKQEMSTMTEGTEEYRVAMERLGQMQDQYGDISTQGRIFADDNKNIKATMDAVSGLSGAMTAGVGVASLFGMEEEKLAQIQTKLQAVMAITMGVQQVANTLNKDSYFTHVLLGKGTTMLTAANNRLAVSLGISTIAAKALMATLTLGVSVAIGALILLWDRYTDKQDEAKKAQEAATEAAKKQAEAEDGLRKSAASSVSTQLLEYKKLQAAYRELGEDIKKKEKFVKNNKKAFDELGIAVTGVKDAENLLIDGEAAFLRTMNNRALIAASMELAAEKYKEAIAKMMEVDAKKKKAETYSNKDLDADDNTLASRMAADKVHQLRGGGFLEGIADEDMEEKLKEYAKTGNKFYVKALNIFNEEKSKALESVVRQNKGALERNAEEERKNVEKFMNEGAESLRNGTKLTQENKDIFQLAGFVPTTNKDKTTGDSKESLTAKIADADLKARQKIDDMYLSLMAEGAEKERAQAARDFELEKQRIQKEATERLALYESLKKAGAKVDPNQPAVIKRQAESQQVLAGVDYDNKIDGVNEKETQGKRDNLDKLLKPYRDFAQQRIDIEKQYNADIEQLQKEKDNAKGDAGKEQLISDSIVVAEEEKANALAELDRVFAEKDVYFQVLMSRLGAMSLEELQKALVNAEKALQNSEVSGGKNSKETVVARAKVAALKDEIKVAKAEEETKAPDDLAKWKKTSASIKKCKGEIDNMIDSMDFLDESTKAALQTASNVAGGAIAMIDGIKTLSVSAGESISAVEKASVILAIVGAAIQIMTAIFSMASAAEEKHQKTLKEIADAKLAMQREYNLLLLQQNLLMKEATTIFGEKEIAKAANAVAVYREAIRQYKEELKGEVPTFKLTSLNINESLGDYKKQKAAYDKGVGALNNVEIKTGHKKTGLFGWGKGKDIYSSVLSVYPDLIDAENKLNVERAKTIINTQTMSDDNKNLLQSLIDLQEQAEEAQEALRDYLQDTFGGLGEGMMNSITEAIQTGVDGWESFGNKGAEVLEDLGKQIAYSLFFADKFKSLQKELETIYGSGKSEENIAKDAMNLLGDFYANIGKDMDLAQDFMKNWQEEAAKKGFDLWKPEETEQSGKAGTFTTMSQDQGTKLEGLFTSVQGHVSNIDDTVKDIVMAMYEAADMLAQIVANTAYCRHLEQMAEDIAELKRDGFKMQ